MPHPLALVTAVAQTDSVSLGDILGAIGWVVGLVAGVQQLGSWAQRRRYRRAEELVLETALTKLDAEAAQEDLATATAKAEVVKQQLQVEVPREARRVYLRSRVEAMQDRLSADVEEFQALNSELSKIDSGRSELDASLQAVIEATIKPGYVRRRRAEASTRYLQSGLGVLVLVAIFTPWSGFDLWAPFLPLTNPDDFAPAALLGAALAVIGVTSLAGFGLGTLLILPQGRLANRRVLRATLVVCLVAGVAVAAWGGVLHQRATTMMLETEEARSLRGMYEPGASSQRTDAVADDLRKAQAQLDLILARSKDPARADAAKQRVKQLTRQLASNVQADRATDADVRKQDATDSLSAVLVAFGGATTGVAFGLLAALSVRERRLREGVID